MGQQNFLWAGFGLLIMTMLALDLGWFHRKAHEVKLKESLIWTAVWIGLALCFNVAVYFLRGPETALNFFAGYLLEESLSVDNLFVFLLIFTYFRVPAAYQHRVLFWGILGAVVMRALFIGAGVALLHAFHWIVYVFGAILIVSGLKLAFGNERSVDPSKNPLVKVLRRFIPVTEHYEGAKFFVKKEGRTYATPLFIVLMMLETTDLIFAMDSIPAILAITTDSFVVFTSNIFAILGLRALYFALAGMMQMFRYLSYGLALILVFVGVKMFTSEWISIPIHWALAVIVTVLAVSVVASLVHKKPD